MQLTKLFQRAKSVISRHISNIFKERELLQDSVVAKYATTAADEKNIRSIVLILTSLFGSALGVPNPDWHEFLNSQSLNETSPPPLSSQ